MPYTLMTTIKPGPRMQEAESAEELASLLAEVTAIREANGGEMVLGGQDTANGVFVSISTYPDVEAATKASFEISVSRLVEIVSSGRFISNEDFFTGMMAAMDRA